MINIIDYISIANYCMVRAMKILETLIFIILIKIFIDSLTQALIKINKNFNILNKLL